MVSWAAAGISRHHQPHSQVHMAVAIRCQHVVFVDSNWPMFQFGQRKVWKQAAAGAHESVTQLPSMPSRRLR